MSLVPKQPYQNRALLRERLSFFEWDTFWYSVVCWSSALLCDHNVRTFTDEFRASHTYNSIHWKRYIPEIHQIEKLRFLSISRYRFKLRFWFHLNLCRGMRVSRFGGLVGCSNFCGKCHTSWSTHIPTCQYLVSRSISKRICMCTGISRYNMDTQWPWPTRCLIFALLSPPKTPIVSGWFAERDLKDMKDKAAYGFYPPCTLLCMRKDVTALDDVMTWVRGRIFQIRGITHSYARYIFFIWGGYG